MHREIKENLQTANVSNVELNALQRQRPADVSRGRDFVREVKIGEVRLCLGFNSLNERFEAARDNVDRPFRARDPERRRTLLVGRGS